MIILRIDISDAQAQAYFDYAGYKVRDAREPLRQIMHDVVWNAIGKQLDSEGSRGGRPYDQLSDDYLERKIREGYGGQPILRRTGAMAGRNIGDRTGALFAPDSYIVTRTRLIYDPELADAEVDYTNWHQTGGYEFGRPPQREILVLIRDDVDSMQDIMTEWLDDLRTANRNRGATDPNFQAPLPDVFVL